MADNRMWLCHRPSGLAVFLGKRYTALGWYQPHAEITGALLEALYKAVQDFCISEQENDEDFVLLKETDDSWSYGETLENGLRKIIFRTDGE